MDAGFSLAPLLFGPLLDAGHYALAFYGVAGLQLLAVVTALGVGAGYRRGGLLTATRN